MFKFEDIHRNKKLAFLDGLLTGGFLVYSIMEARNWNLAQKVQSISDRLEAELDKIENTSV
jgi:hypothetical protein